MLETIHFVPSARSTPASAATEGARRLIQSRIVDASIVSALRRLDSLEDYPPACVRVVVQGVRSMFFRWGPVLLRLAAGEITGLWMVRPYDAPLRFGSDIVDGVALGTPDRRAVMVSLLGVRGAWEQAAREALVALAVDIDRRVTLPVSREFAAIDHAREEWQRFCLDRSRNPNTDLLSVPIVPPEFEAPEQAKKVRRGPRI